MTRINRHSSHCFLRLFRIHYLIYNYSRGGHYKVQTFQLTKLIANSDLILPISTITITILRRILTILIINLNAMINIQTLWWLSILNILTFLVTILTILVSVKTILVTTLTILVTILTIMCCVYYTEYLDHPSYKPDPPIHPHFYPDYPFYINDHPSDCVW